MRAQRKSKTPHSPTAVLINSEFPVINTGDTITPSSVTMDNHYLRLGIHKLWTATRYRRLAAYLNETEYELASRIMCPHRDMKKYLAKDSFPSIVSWCLTLIEVCVAKGKFPDCPIEPDENFFPSYKT